MLETVNRILIIQTAFLGDVILTLPLVQELKRNIPAASIDFMCIPSTLEIFDNNPLIKDIIVYDKHKTGKGIPKLNKIIKLVKEKEYDAVISPHRSARSAMITFFSGSKKSISFDTSSFSYLYSDKVEYLKGIHEIQRNLKLLKPLGIESNEIIRPQLFISPEDEFYIDGILAEAGVKENEKFITLAPGSVWFTKRYPKEKFLNLINMLTQEGIKVFLIGGETDKPAGDYLTGINSLVKNMTGSLSILQSAELIRRSAVLITNDSAPLHIANSVGTKVAALFGSTVPQFGFYPYGSSDVVFEVTGLKCRPCGIHGYNKCPIGTFECMTKIEEADVFEIVKEM